jgi:CRISPR system Cascade subunit CasA
VLNLITDAWLPVRRLHSGRCTIRPSQLTETICDDPVIAIDWPRADFRIATLELLIGLLATACPPHDHDS